MNFFREDCNFYIKNKIKSEIFKDKKSLWIKMFFPVITRNLNWEILKKNLVTFKIWDGLKMKNFNIMGVHWKIRFLDGGFMKPIYMGGLTKKVGLDSLQLVKKRGCLEGELILQCTLWKFLILGALFPKCEFSRKIRHFWGTPFSTCTISKHIYERIMKEMHYERTNRQTDSNS